MSEQRPPEPPIPQPPSPITHVELHVEELVLEGVAAGDRYRMAEALEGELMRLLGEGGLPASFDRSAEIERLDGGAISLAPGTRAETLGARVARAVYGSLPR